MKKKNERVELSLHYLEQLIKKRSGGAINLRGINFQVLYSVSKVLSYLSDDNSEKHIRLEGVEDLDINTPQLELDSCQYIQLKSSQNRLNASAFWTMGVMQNFLEVFAIDPTSRFKLVHNMNISDGNLAALSTGNLTGKTLTYWTEKMNTYSLSKNVDLVNFFASITFEQIDVRTLMDDIVLRLGRNWGVNRGTENIFLRSLFYHVFNWSIERKCIFHSDLVELFTEVRDAFSKALVNEALKNEWLSEVSYSSQSTSDLNDYFDGKACKPAHVANGIPARRQKWEKEVFESLVTNDITLIRSSSGQGKSTIAWQIGYNVRDTYQVYQLNSSNTWDQVNSLVELLTARIEQGQLPLIIIDGLSAQTKDWGMLADKTSGLPIKYIITSRHEDWQIYGADLSKLRIKMVDIFLTHPEAKELFLQLKSKGKISPEIHAWEPVWEVIKEKGLLIEYTYLLTRGQMISDRLAYQIKHINKGNDSPEAKIEILRIIAMADCLQLSVETQKLLNYINDNIGFNSDRESVLQSLENEYFVNFEKKNVIGLHPVRSQHLIELLHNYVGIDETLIKLYPLINEDLRYDFFINAPLLLDQEESQAFYGHFADYLANGDYAEMVIALDGVIHSEPQRYWINNRSVFDEVFDSGGIDLFIMNSIPFSDISLEGLASALPSDMKGALNNLIDKKKLLSSFSIKETDVYRFAFALANVLKIRERKPNSFIGLEFLTLWFKKLDIEFNSDLKIDHEEMISLLKDGDFQQAREVFSTLNIQQPVKYADFINNNKEVIISLLKIKTQTPTLFEQGNDIVMEYLIMGDEANRANELSVARINELYNFLPHYQSYCTDAIILPYPSSDLVQAVLQNAHKKMPPENIGNNFDVHLNQIWISVISDNYNASSAYEWQSQIIEFRKLNLQYIGSISRYIESLIEGKREKAKTYAAQIDSTRKGLNILYASSKKYPSFGRKSFRIAKFADQEKVIKKWLSALSNVRAQIVHLFNVDDLHKRNLVLINYKDALFNLDGMQQAFKEIEKGSYPYFETDDLVKRESEEHQRLYHTILYYIAHIPLETKNAVRVGKIEIANWWKVQKDKDLKYLQQLLDQISQGSNFKFYAPVRLRETYTLVYATFGVEGENLNDSESIVSLLLLLAPLADFPADFFTIVRVREAQAIGAFRIHKDFIIQVKDYVDGCESDFSNHTPIPQIPDQEMLMDLPGISLPDVKVNRDKEALVLCLLDLWKIGEYRRRLNPSSLIEQNWLKKTVSDLTFEINSRLKSIQKTHNNYSNLISWINMGLKDNHKGYSGEEISEKLMEIGSQ